MTAAKRSLISIALLVLAGCVLARSARALDALPYFPLAVGNQWTYDLGSIQGTIATDPFMESIGDAQTWLLAPIDPGFANTGEYFSNDAQGLRYHAIAVEALGIAVLVVFDPPIQLVPASTSLPATIPASGDAILRVPGPDPILSYTATAQLYPLENVTVPAGSFMALPVQLSFTISGTVNGQPLPPLASTGTLWLAPGVGKVKETSTFDGNLIQADLVSYVVMPEPGPAGAQAAALAVLALVGAFRCEQRASRSRG